MVKNLKHWQHQNADKNVKTQESSFIDGKSTNYGTVTLEDSLAVSYKTMHKFTL